MSRARLDPKTKKAIDEFASRLDAAMRMFRASDDPLWRRTWDGMSCFAKLPLAHLPRTLQKDIDRRFLRINKITSKYPIKTEEDYRHISVEDLVAIQDLIIGFAFDGRDGTPITPLQPEKT